MTIAQNVLSVASNWSGGTVGSGAIPRGNSDSTAATDATTDLTGINKRTLTLTNGQVIWDIAGNVREWTTGQTTGGQPGIVGGGLDFREWNAITTHGTLSPDPFPSSTGIAGSSAWTSAQGIGKLYSDTDNISTHGFLRGGAWGSGWGGVGAGVLALDLSYSVDGPSIYVGFRVSR
jgi:formylglycine-generating enzyme required for sulfatase activity